MYFITSDGCLRYLFALFSITIITSPSNVKRVLYCNLGLSKQQRHPDTGARTHLQIISCIVQLKYEAYAQMDRLYETVHSSTTKSSFGAGFIFITSTG